MKIPQQILSKILLFKEICYKKACYSSSKRRVEELEKITRDLRFENDILRNEQQDLRATTSKRWIMGSGIEIGPLHKPLYYRKENATVKYVDRLGEKELRQQYPELKDLEITTPDYIDDGEVLNSQENNSLDFIIANHMIEHCKNPIKTIQNHLEKLKLGGILYYTIPNKEFTFDKKRKLTTIKHLVDDYYEKNNHDRHFFECVKDSEGYTDPKQIKTRVKKLMDMNYSIHCHVWNKHSLIEFFLFLTTFEQLKDRFEMELVVSNGEEIIVILRKL